ncbi:MAG: XdhC family protein [Ignavibacteriae bacterium]|nr:XdhC family protein [Ignavibacteriota bacterium]
MDIYDEILRALETEPRVMMATIISTTGSTPAAALSKMLVKQGGIASVGTVGGGCMEGEVLLHANRLYDVNRAEVITFHLNEDDIEHGLICGGSLDVLIEPLWQDQIDLFRQLKLFRDDGDDCILTTVLSRTGVVKEKFLLAVPPRSQTGNDAIEPHLSSTETSSTATRSTDFPELLRRAYYRQQTQRVQLRDGGEMILEPVFGLPSLVIFGGGHVSKYVSRAASMAGFRVTIVDDREKFANSQRFPEASQTLVLDFLEAFRKLTIKPSTYIIIVTRGHQYDEQILEQALKTPARYIGMIGSKRKVFTTFEHLVQQGVTIEQLERVSAPMGIDIGAVTAEEIGISIVAQLIRVRRGQQNPLQNKSDEMKKLLSSLQQR